MVMENVKRIVRHLLMTHWRVGRSFPEDVLREVEQAIAKSESSHFGQLCFVVEGALSLASLFAGQSARDRAVEVFSQMRVWDTEHNNGVLIYLLLAPATGTQSVGKWKPPSDAVSISTVSSMASWPSASTCDSISLCETAARMN
jgi:hypothetical protein